MDKEWPFCQRILTHWKPYKFEKQWKMMRNFGMLNIYFCHIITLISFEVENHNFYAVKLCMNILLKREFTTLSSKTQMKLL